MPEGLITPPARTARRPKLAIVSSWNESCGNASYTFALKKEFERSYDVEVLGLDLFMLQRRGGIFTRLGNRHIDEIAKKLSEFDYVNIQFEAGLYGATLRTIRKRVLRLIDAAPNLILTMHRVDMQENSFMDDIYASLKRFSIDPWLKARQRNEFAGLYGDIIRACKSAAQRKNVWIKVHTKRERRMVNEAFRYDNCIDFPLCYLDAPTRDAIRAARVPGAVQQRYALPANAKIIGAFGYISNYKGFETLIHAISVLPPEWHLLVVGSQHPQSVKAWTEVDPYLDMLVKQIETGGVDAASWLPKRLQAQIRFSGKAEDIGAVRQSARALMDRVRFVGNVDDDEFTFLLRNVDATVLPYLEVGQSMSGVVALAVESGARLFCSNTLSFGEARRYYGRVFGSFDIGNYIEVAQKVQFEHVDYDAQRDSVYARYNIERSIDLHRHIYEQHSIPSPEKLSEMGRTRVTASA